MAETKTISTEVLEENGYKEYNKETSEQGERVFQKRFDDDKGKKYFINCKYYFYAFNGEQKRFWDFSMQIDTPRGAVNINTVQWFNQDGEYSQNTINKVEEYFKKMWLANDKPYYELFVVSEKNDE